MTTKSVFVTGANSGLGRAIALTLAERGYLVFAGMRELAGKNAAAAEEMRNQGAGGRCLPMEIDVTETESVDAALASAKTRAGGLDVVVNCAGIMWLGVTEAFNIAQFDTVMQTNLYGPFRVMRAALPIMRAQNSGLFIAISSISGRLVTPGSGLYAASKWGLEALAEALRYEAAPLGIDSVIVQPGPFRTNLKVNAKPPAEPAIADAYGELRELEKTVPARMASYMAQHPDITTDTQDVAECVSTLIAMPRGTRPLRATVGHDLGAAAINRDVSVHQRDYLSLLGLDSLLQTRDRF